MIWEKFIGKPFEDRGRGPDSYDCLGLVLAVLKENGINMPDMWTYETANDEKALANFMHTMATVDTPLSGLRSCAPGELAIVVFRIRGLVRHVGVMVDKENFVHVMEGTHVCRESLLSPTWMNRVAGIYRWSL